ncbi:MAG: tetratricopeptide repeat protein [Candidatus Heimdallarchaeota archaeon]|nr:tetratricopeptide repeat protein [Candidatus Heimdallarchaeota archaeon]
MMSNLTIYYRVINDVENALEIRLQIEKHLEVFVNQHGHIPKNVDGKPNLTFLGNYGTLGNIYMLEGELITAERYFNKVLDYSDSDTTHLDLARFYINSGRIDKAEYHLNVSQTKPVRNPDNLTEVDYLVGKARVNNLMGKPSSVEINSASDLIEAHLNEKEFVTSSIAIETYFHIAGIHMANSDLVEAKKNYYKVSEMCKIVHYFDFHRAECLMKLVQISCIEDEDAERDNYKTELDNLVDEYSSHGKMILFQKLAEAIILKHTKGIQRGISRFKAQEIFQKISQGKIYDINLHFFARFNYCELLLDAYQFYGEEEILDILVKEVEDLATISKEKVLILYNIEVLILRSKIATLQKDLDSSINFLEEAQTLADERNLITYQDRIKTEKETYLQNIDSWNSMRKDDKIEKLRLKQYLKFAQQNITK